MNKGGRPKLEEPRIKTLAYKVTESEHKKLKDLAESRGLKVGTFARNAALEIKIPKGIKPKIDLATWTELARIGNNLNQVTRHLHKTGDQSGLYETIAGLLIQIEQIRTELMEA
jgi:hypothetical protein